MALDWRIISENVINISQLLADFLDTKNPKDVEWVYLDEDGNINSFYLPNLAKMASLLGKKYIGASDTEPTSELDGDELKTGDMYFDTSRNQMMVYNGSEWEPVAFASSLKEVDFTGDGETTEFVVENGYNPNMGLVFLNGVNVTKDVDITNGKSIIFSEAPADGDEIFAIFYNNFEATDAMRLSDNNVTVGDLEFELPEKGVILRDRSLTDDNGNPVRYRLFIDNGDLKIEEL